jgi:hypothetical protein
MELIENLDVLHKLQFVHMYVDHFLSKNHLCTLPAQVTDRRFLMAESCHQTLCHIPSVC